jgi:hypothetical protein
MKKNREKNQYLILGFFMVIIILTLTLTITGNYYRGTRGFVILGM